MINESTKHLYNIFARLGWDLAVECLHTLRFLSALLLWHLTILQIRLIGNKIHEPVSPFVVVEHFYPEIDVIQRWFFAYVVDHESAVGIFEVAGDQWAESLLTCGVPEL